MLTGIKSKIYFQVLCYSVDSFDSYTSAECEISPEIKKRFSGVPIILVATKSELSRDQQTDKR